jgi:two-component system OmpR family response regulator
MWLLLHPAAVTRCLLIDDDEQIRATLSDYLRGFGMVVHTAADGAGLREALAAHPFQLIILDVMLPGENGLDLCRWLRQQHHTTPVIMLTAQGDPISRVLGLEMGADDYLGKPFEPRELVARIHAVLRRVPRAEPAPAEGGRHVHFDGWALDSLQRLLVSPSHVVVALSNAEYRLLAAFVSRPGRVLTREQLVEATASTGTDVQGRSVDLAVSRLRQKLGDNQSAQMLIRTVRGEGYLFAGKVAP